jgi:hypothetical protein
LENEVELVSISILQELPASVVFKALRWPTRQRLGIWVVNSKQNQLYQDTLSNPFTPPLVVFSIVPSKSNLFAIAHPERLFRKKHPQ